MGRKYGVLGGGGEKKGVPMIWVQQSMSPDGWRKAGNLLLLSFDFNPFIFFCSYDLNR